MSCQLRRWVHDPPPHQGCQLYFKELWPYCLLSLSTAPASVQALNTSYTWGSPHYNPSSAVSQLAFKKAGTYTSLAGSKYFMTPSQIKSKLLTVVQKAFSALALDFFLWLLPWLFPTIAPLNISFPAKAHIAGLWLWHAMSLHAFLCTRYPRSCLCYSMVMYL